MLNLASKSYLYIYLKEETDRQNGSSEIPERKSLKGFRLFLSLFVSSFSAIIAKIPILARVCSTE